jgi:hypothetical protein
LTRVGFQHISPERRRAIAQMGGAKGGHRFTAEEARLAGKIGGKKAPRSAKSAAGREGGLAKGRKKKEG